MKYLLWAAIACLVLAAAAVVFFFVSSAMMPQGSGANIGGGLAMLAAGPLATIRVPRARRCSRRLFFRELSHDA